MYKIGDIIEIYGEKYKVTQAASNIKRCSICQHNGHTMPCTLIYNYTKDQSWSVNKCMSNIPEDCYLKKVKSN